MYLKKGDNVVVIAGADKGKEGIIEKVLPNGKLIIENIKLAKKHTKPDATHSEGGIIEVEMAIDASNVSLFDEKTKKPTRVGFKIKDAKKIRVSKKTGKEI
ncbi:MAG: 50S ribosomal protein L24 [Spiroplasma sp.]|nr:50S ribosomal protein L24 [Mycoplasmatales bacterium]